MASNAPPQSRPRWYTLAMGLAEVEMKLREFALSFPEATEEFPWGERAVKVKKKVFLFMRRSEDALSLSVKLPQSNEFALHFAFATPTRYGLGKSGWVTCRFTNMKELPDLAMLRDWIRESFRAVAPAKLREQLEAAGGEIVSSAGSNARSRSPRKKK